MSIHVDVENFLEKVVQLDLFTKVFVGKCNRRSVDHVDVCREAMKKQISKESVCDIDFLIEILDLNIDNLKKTGKLLDCFDLLSNLQLDLYSGLARIRDELFYELEKEVDEFVNEVLENLNKKLWKEWSNNREFPSANFGKSLKHLILDVSTKNRFKNHDKKKKENMTILLDQYFNLKELREHEKLSQYSWMPWNMSQRSKSSKTQNKSRCSGSLLCD